MTDFMPTRNTRTERDEFQQFYFDASARPKHAGEWRHIGDWDEEGKLVLLEKQMDKEAELRAAIMNIEAKWHSDATYKDKYPSLRHAYLHGHKDARHAAADLVMTSAALERPEHPVGSALTDEQIDRLLGEWAEAAGVHFLYFSEHRAEIGRVRHNDMKQFARAVLAATPSVGSALTACQRCNGTGTEDGLSSVGTTIDVRCGACDGTGRAVLAATPTAAVEVTDEQLSHLIQARCALSAPQKDTGAAPAAVSEWNIWCETCEGSGKVYQEPQHGCHVGGDYACPDCDGKGYFVKRLSAQPAVAPSDSAKPEPQCVIAMDEGAREPRLVSWNTFPVGTHWLYLAAAPTPDSKVCKGTNCHAINGVGHSVECEAEHAAAVNAERPLFDKNWPSEGHVTDAEWAARVGSAPEAGKPVAPDMRHILIVQIHNLIDLAERYSRHMHKRGDADERDRIDGEIAHVRKTIGPYNYNGPTHPSEADGAREETRGTDNTEAVIDRFYRGETMEKTGAQVISDEPALPKDKIIALAEKCSAEVGRYEGEVVWVKFHSQSSIEAFATGVVMSAVVHRHKQTAKTPVDGAQAAGQEDAARLDWLEQQGYAYGFEDMHEGNRWTIEGPFRTLRAAIDECMAPSPASGGTKG